MAERLAAARVLLPSGLSGPGVVEVESGQIAAVAPADGERVPDRTLAPGFVDLQVNGLEDVDVADVGRKGWQVLDQRLLAGGVTTWCPTLVTAPLDAYPARLAAIEAAASRPEGAWPRIAGAHLEGPFLGGRPGAHPVHLLRPIDLNWLAALSPVVRLVTLAPELDEAPEAVRLLRDRGVVVSLGHTAATAEQVAHCVDAGATLVTHLFNGMPPLHHRDPGVATAALLDDRLITCVIGDGIHVAPEGVALVLRCKGPGRVALVSDAIAWCSPAHAGSASDACERAKMKVELVDGAARLADGTLAGSAITLDAAVRTAVAGGVGLADALAAASTTPAAALGLTDRGAIEPGRRADLVALGPDLAVQSTWVAGRKVHQ